MSTKNNPGAWRCYEAALPDEPIFTILARDPAGPATLRFWAGQRIFAGKLGNPEDEDRIDNARQEADEMEAWREANLDPVGDGSGPSWKLLAGINDDELGPVRSLPDSTVYIYAERDGSEAVRVSIEWLRSLTGQLTRGDITREFYAELIEAACQSPDRRRERVVPVEEANTIRHLMPDDSFVVDSAPDDLAHGPEVPPHRFSTFHKGKRYAYARGLEINPVHLPTALDAMAEDGWNLLAIFGQTDSKHVGFIFERQPQMTLIPSGTQLMMLCDDPPILSQPCGLDGRGRGLEP